MLLKWRIKMDNNEMKQYVVAAAKKDNKAMEILYKELYTDVVYICRSLNLNEEDANDVAQETFIKAFSQLDKLEDKGKFKQWVFRIANNKCLDLLRHNKVIQFDSIDAEESTFELPDKSKSADEIVMEKETSQLLMSIIEKLPIEQRTTVFLFFYQDYSVKEIAQMYGCSENTVRSRLNYAKKFMAKEIDKLDTDKKNRCLVLLPFIYMVFANQRQAFACEIPNCVSVVSAVMSGKEVAANVGTASAQGTATDVGTASAQGTMTNAGATFSQNVAVNAETMGAKSVVGGSATTKVVAGGASMAGKSVLVKIIIGIICAAVVAGAVIVGTGVFGDSGKDSKRDKTQNEESLKGGDTSDKEDGVHNEDADSDKETSKADEVIAKVRNKAAEIKKFTVVGEIGYSDFDARFVDVENGVFEDVGTWYGYGYNGFTDTDGKSYMYYMDCGNGTDASGACGKKELSISIGSYPDVINSFLDEVETAGADIKEDKNGRTIIYADLDMRKLDVIFEYLGEVESVKDIEGNTTVEVCLYEDYTIREITVLNETVLKGYEESLDEKQISAMISTIGAGGKLEFTYELDEVEAPYVSDEFEQLMIPGTISAVFRDYPAQYTINMGTSWDFITYSFPEMYNEAMRIEGKKNGYKVKVFFIDETDYEDRKIYSKEELEALINGASHSMSAVFMEYKNADIELTWITINGMEMVYDSSSPSWSLSEPAMGTLAVVKCVVGDEERALCILVEDPEADQYADVDTSKESRQATLEEIVSDITVKKIERPRMDREEVKEIAESVI